MVLSVHRHGPSALSIAGASTKPAAQGRSRMMILVLPMLLGMQLLVPIADGVPTLRVEASCRAAAEASKQINLTNAESYDACLRGEKQARETLVGSWTTYTPAERNLCISEATHGGSPSYVELLVCLQMMHDANELQGIRPKGGRAAPQSR
jgi:hypothetical protein